MIPAAGQGIVVIEALRDSNAAQIVRDINDSWSELAAHCERGVLQQFGEQLDCYSCVAVHTTHENGELTIRAFLSDYEASTPLCVIRRGTDPQRLIEDVANELVAGGAMELLRSKTR